MVDCAFTEEQRDALQEVANVGMGQAGARLARLLNAFVALSVPRIRVIERAELLSALEDMTSFTGTVTAVRQGFKSDINGEAVVIFDGDGIREIAAAFSDEDENDETEVAYEAANILIGACLASVFEQLNCALTYSAPRLIGRNIPLEAVVQPDTLHWSAALLLEVNFALEGRSFRAHLVTLTADESIVRLRVALDDLLASI
ncbi:chemotaxis protein [Pararobbsia silviterrae]|uniref:Chemotaxis protein n=1 Tax=Pararobbsia silviterrae TaxID=1792498 RepID=A0A494X697_9BURK|nr:chemotaxis protein [Pararobbsia silviterrae]RKP43766.1 chemotaxis protein [Pararobbsia silviterrae]